MTGQDWSLHDLLRSMGLKRSYEGYRYLLHALELLREDPERVELVTKEIYPDVARKFKVHPSAVDGALRTALNVCWWWGPWELTGREDAEEEVPSVSMFLDRLAWMDRKNRQKE